MKPKKIWIPDNYKAYSQEQYKEFSRLRIQYDEIDPTLLKQLLYYNKQKYMGPKTDLVHRVADGVLQGAIERCPNCKEGYPEYDFERGTYYCDTKQQNLAWYGIKGCGKIFKNLYRTPFKMLSVEQLQELHVQAGSPHLFCRIGDNAPVFRQENFI